MEIVKLEKPGLPVTWDYDISVSDVKGSVYKWKNLTENIAYELWIAREMLRNQGARTDLTSEQKFRSWTQYCEDIGSSIQVVNRWLLNWFEPKQIAHVSHNSGENEWYTPGNIIESARFVMGGIDTDPASSDIANETVKAPIYFTEETNGLDNEWGGNIWLNPPYSQPLISDFSEAVVSKRDEYNQAIILVNNATETSWLQQMMGICDAVCFPKSRIKFLDMNGDASGAPLQGQILLYIGEDINIFINEFEKYGLCLVRAGGV